MPQIGNPDEQELVIVPAHPAADTGMVEFEICQLPDGNVVLPVFSTVAGLVDEFGPYQPWASIPISAAQQAAAEAGVTRVALDPVLRTGAWRWHQSDTAASLGHDTAGGGQ
jgi:hypothetical protein